MWPRRLTSRGRRESLNVEKQNQEQEQQERQQQRRPRKRKSDGWELERVKRKNPLRIDPGSRTLKKKKKRVEKKGSGKEQRRWNNTKKEKKRKKKERETEWDTDFLLCVFFSSMLVNSRIYLRVISLSICLFFSFSPALDYFTRTEEKKSTKEVRRRNLWLWANDIG